MLFFRIVLCVVGRFAYSVPTHSQLGRRYRSVFSGEKLPQGIFCAKTGGLNVEGIVPPS